MKNLLLATAVVVLAAAPAHADAWSPVSLPDAAPVALVALGFIAIAGAMRGRKL